MRKQGESLQPPAEIRPQRKAWQPTKEAKMNGQDLQKMAFAILYGAMSKGVKTVAEYMEICKANNLNTNAQRLQYFTA